jgi:cytochrome c oxidase subunit 2
VGELVLGGRVDHLLNIVPRGRHRRAAKLLYACCGASRSAHHAARLDDDGAVGWRVDARGAAADCGDRAQRPHADPSALHGERGGLAWIYIGTGVSSVVLLATLVYVLITLASVAAPARTPTLTITVTAYDWWWKVAYQDAADPALNFVTANEIHIPVAEPVKVALQSADVVHAFWVPQLAGKTQTIPGQINEQWIEADQPGVYRGQCSQFCGAQHAHMAFEVVAQSPTAFAAWRAAQAQGQATQSAAAADAAAGKRLFGDRCAGCHAIRGTDAEGVQGPDLTHLDSRHLIAAGTLTNAPAHQLDWIEHAQQIKPDSLMPDIALTIADAAALSAYLSTLH